MAIFSGLLGRAALESSDGSPTSLRVIVNLIFSISISLLQLSRPVARFVVQFFNLRTAPSAAGVRPLGERPEGQPSGTLARRSEMADLLLRSIEIFFYDLGHRPAPLPLSSVHLPAFKRGM